MKALGVAVGLFAVVAAWAGLRTGDNVLDVTAAFAAVCAVTTILSAQISRYLRIFVAIFSTETIVLGLMVVAAKLGLWPADWADFAPTDKLPMTVATFSILVYAVSHWRVVRDMTKIADLYFTQNDQGLARIWPFGPFAAHERAIAVAMVVALVVINQVQVAIMVRLSFFNRDWFNAIQEKNAPDFWRLLLWVFLPWAFIYVVSAVVEFVLQSMLIIRWRKWLTEHYVAQWLGGHAHYRMNLAGGEADNPDQRIAEDVARFIDGGTEGYGIYSYSILLISTLSSLVSFSFVLWSLSGNYAFPGTDVVIPGFLFWVALVYAAIGTAITHLIGRSLVGIYFDRQKVEADFRFQLARLREYSEQVALLSGEKAERAALGRRFAAVIANYLRLVDRRKKLMAFTAGYGQVSPIIPYVFAAPFYFAGKIQLGVMTQTAQAFARVEGALTFFINYYTSLAGFKSVLDRLTSFDQAIARAHEAEHGGARRQSAPAAGDLGLHAVRLTLPDGRAIIETDRIDLKPGVASLVNGPSGSGKSTLFRAIAGVWPYGSGEIRIPEGARVMVLPQRPYLPNGALRSAVSYPAEPGAYSDESIRAALRAAHLPGLVDRLDDADSWSLRLSGGEQQRLAIARALLAKPDWLLLDEATAALDEKLEAAIYKTIAERLPDTTVLSIGHRTSLNDLHGRRFELTPQPDGVFAPHERV